MPAAGYVEHGREQDAVKLFQRFLATMRQPVKRGQWLSHDGLDSTDLPVVDDLFCNSPDQLQRDLCEIGILKTLAASHFTDDDFNFDQTAPDFPKLYGGQPARFRSPQLEAYLRLWGVKAVADLQPPPGDFSQQQSAAWHYGAGVVLLRAASKLMPDQGCPELLQKSQEEFGQSVQDDGQGYFTQPSQHRLRDLMEKGMALCFSTKPTSGQN